MPERNFMQAAEVAIKDLQVRAAEAHKAADDAATSAAEAKVQAAEARRQTTTWKRVTVALAVIAALTLGTAGGGIYLWRQQAEATSQLRQQAIATCTSGNILRAENVQTWEKNFALQAQTAKTTAVLATEFIDAVSNGDPVRAQQIRDVITRSGKANAEEVKAFLKFVRETNAPRNCTQAYSPHSSARPHALDPLYGGIFSVNVGRR